MTLCVRHLTSSNCIRVTGTDHIEHADLVPAPVGASTHPMGKSNHPEEQNRVALLTWSTAIMLPGRWSTTQHSIPNGTSSSSQSGQDSSSQEDCEADDEADDEEDE